MAEIDAGTLAKAEEAGKDTENEEVVDVDLTAEPETTTGIEDTPKVPTQEEYDTLVRERETDRERFIVLEAENQALRQPAPVQQQPTTKDQEFVFYSPEDLTKAVDQGTTH